MQHFPFFCLHIVSCEKKNTNRWINTTHTPHQWDFAKDLNYTTVVILYISDWIFASTFKWIPIYFNRNFEAWSLLSIIQFELDNLTWQTTLKTTTAATSSPATNFSALTIYNILSLSLQIVAWNVEWIWTINHIFHLYSCFFSNMNNGF